MTRKYPRFCDPTIDVAFKRIFGSKIYKDATIGFINSLLPDKQVQDVEFLNVEIPGFTAEDRKSCVDILCTGDDGSNFVIEMQVVKQEFFRQRTVLYASTLISHLAEKGDGWNYELKPTYVISVLDFTLDESSPEGCILHYISKEVQTGIPLPGAPEFFFLEPRRFKKKESELQTYPEKWLYLLHNAKSLAVIPEAFSRNKAFKAYFDASETANMTKQERILYDQAMITKTDIEYGKLYSFKEGKAEGKAEASREVAKRLLSKEMSIEDIIEVTGLSADDVEKL